jgi:hypothetical protein
MALPARLSRPIRWGIGLVALLAVGEVLLRTGARFLGRERGIRFDAQLGWRMLPGITRAGPMWGGSRATTLNSDGWRDTEFGPRASGVRRIVVVGDSFTFGVGVDDGERYTELLERALDDLEVLNLGMNAVGPDQELLVLEQHGLALAPDLVLCQVLEDNDFTDVACTINGYWPKPWFRLRADQLELVPPSRTWDVRLRESSYLGETLYRLLQPTRTYKSLAPEWDGVDTSGLIARLLVRMRASSEEAGARFAVLLVATGKRAREMNELRAALEREGIARVEVRAWFDSAEERARYLLPDGHWTAEGHRLAAEVLRTELARTAWLPPGR